MMKKVFPLLLPALVCLVNAHAQIRLGVLGGIHSANILETNNIPNWDRTTKKYESSRSGVQLGVILDVPLGKGFYFQPAILYTTRGRQYLKNNDSTTSANTDTVYSKQNLNLGYVDIPLNLTYKIRLSRDGQHNNSFFISAGPYLSFFYQGNLIRQRLTLSDPKYLSETDPLSVGKGSDTYKLIDVGLNGRAGFELGKVLLSAYYSQGLTNFYNAPYSGTFHHKIFGASLGIWLTSTETPPPPVKDMDKDGIPDDQDLCPTKPGTLKWHGCPVPDTDHDGIDDEHDSCRTVPGLARYNGCPIPDTDQDGIDDEHDSCRTVPGVARYKGCPIPDRDGDGVNDEEDKCPDEPGTAANQGCPEIKKEVTEQINYTAKNILFASGSDRLTTGSQPPLADIASLLIAHPQWQMTIEGYTDDAGKPDKNLLLSQKRAEAVKAFLVKKGVLPDRLVAIGYGNDHPIADNHTEAGRSANRRVELKLSIGKK